MMLSIEEAILHAEEVAEEEEKQATWLQSEGNPNYENCVERAKKQRQLAEWLKELRQRRDSENGCQYCKYKFRSDEDEPCVICSHNYTNKFKDDGTREVNADE